MGFVKGQSGNPSGRPKSVFWLQAAAREHSQEALDCLVDLMRGPDQRLRLAAAALMLERGFGKAVQPNIQLGDKSEPPVAYVSPHLVAWADGSVIAVGLPAASESLDDASEPLDAPKSPPMLEHHPVPERPAGSSPKLAFSRDEP